MTKPSDPHDADRDLEGRRAATRRAQTTVDQNNARLSQAKAAMALHDAQTVRHQRAIAEAEQALVENRQALKALERGGSRLADDVKKARKATEKASAQAAKAEARYERSVLDGLVKREKAADRRAHAVSDGPISGSPVRATSTSGPGSDMDDTPELLREPTSTGTKVTPA